tara:strand:+ start:853 stop:1185 length:333 start_codon:yes stop_codon:yes gene_type:complete
MKEILCLEFVKLSKTYNSNHGGKMLYVFFKDRVKIKSYRTVLFDNMRNFNNWSEVINKAERGDFIDNLNIKLYKGKPIIDADSKPKLITANDMRQIENDLYEQEYGIPYY